MAKTPNARELELVQDIEGNERKTPADEKPEVQQDVKEEANQDAENQNEGDEKLGHDIPVDDVEEHGDDIIKSGNSEL